MTNTKITRREVLNLALASPLLAAMPGDGRAQAGKTKSPDQRSFVNAPSAVTPVGAEADIKQIELVRQWRGPLCRARLINRGKAPARIKEVTLFDANFWGAMRGGRFHDPRATRIEAYRRGMQAILRGSGDGFILGCNHPIWPSLGLIHGSRSSNDIKRLWDRIASMGKQNLYRNWQNGRLWWNDPDAIVLMGDPPAAEFQFHATAIYASGGMLLSGDDLTKIAPDRLAMLKKLLPPTGRAAEFTDDSLRVGVVNMPDSRTVCVFNWEDNPQTISVTLPRPSRVTDFWSGEDLGRRKGSLEIKDLPPRSARLLVCK